MSIPKPSGFWRSRSKGLVFPSALLTSSPTDSSPSKSSNLPGQASGIPIFCVKMRSRNYAGICSETNGGTVQALPASLLPKQLASLLVLGRPTSFLRRPVMRCMAVRPVLHPATRAKVAGTVCLSRPYYGFGEVRVATLALLIFTALSG